MLASHLLFLFLLGAECVSTSLYSTGFDAHIKVGGKETFMLSCI